jgi:glutamine synthetase
LNPGGTPHENLKFILFLTAIIRGVDLHQDLLRAAIASAGNDHRLGANEAPPAIISIFVGCQLEEIINSLIEGRAPEQNGSEKLRLGVTSLPDLPRDMSDRNRTSPFAFTGDKFEFRAVSSRQSVAYPSTFLNLIVSESLDFLCDEIERRGGPSTENIEKVVQSTLKDHQRILYGGDNYSQAWTAEAAERGLLNLRGTPEALAGFASETNLSLFERYNVFSRGEAVSRYKVLNEQYAQKVNVEARLMREIATSMIMPAALQYQRDLCDSMNSLTTAMPNADTSTQQTLLTKVTAEIAKLQTATDNLTDIQHAIEASDLEDNELAVEFRERVMPAMGALRLPVDRLERMVDDSLWPLPKYREMLFVH